MSRTSWTAADMAMIESVCQPAVLEQAHESVWGSVPWIKEKREHLHQTTRHGRYTDSYGWFPDYTGQHLASIPLPIWVALLQLDEDFASDAQKQDEFLRGPGRQFNLQEGAR